MKKSIVSRRTRAMLTILAVLISIVLPVMTSEVHAAYANNLRGSLGVHDPVMIKEGNTYYVFATGDNIPMKRSTDGINWQEAGNVFSTPPSWFKTYVPENNGKNIWAPDISYHNGVYYLYYSVSTFGQRISVIGLATNTTLDRNNPNYRWVDKGMVIRSTGSENYNCIDPNRINDQDGRSWLTFGSFWGGLMITELDPATGLRKSNSFLTTIAKRSSGTAIEAPFMIYVNGYYYLFASWDSCCKGVDSTYKIVYGRSKSVTGPFLDMSGKSMAQGGGTILWSGDERWKGPGHNGICIDGDKVLIVYHTYDAQANGAPIMHIRQLYFGSGWPSFTPSGNEPTINPSPTKTPTPSPADFIHGDLNGDRLINAGDYTLMRRYILGLITDFTYTKGMQAADVNGDGRINAGDYTLMRKYILGIITEFPVVAIVPTPTFTKEPEKTPDYRAANTVIRLEAFNNEDFYLRHFDYIARIDANPAPINDSYFLEKPGLADTNCVSFESVNYPGYYLRHEYFELKLVEDDNSNLFKQDATFRKVSGLANEKYTSYQSYNFPDMYIRNVNSLCKITTISTDEERVGATFNVVVEEDTF